jgi:hypothetical protein
MNRKIFSVVTLFLLILNAVGLSIAGPRKKVVVKRQVNPLVAKLPASDAVAIMDARRFFDQALPKLLASRPDIVGKIAEHLNQFQAKTGIDARKFDRIAIGANIKHEAVKDFDFDPVILAQGTINAGSLVAGAKLASNAGYREEKIGEHTIFIFSTKSVADKNMPGSTTGAVDDAMEGMPAEMAVAAFDSNTIIMGSPARVRETFEAKSTVSPEITSLLTSRPNSVFAFSARMPEGVRNLLPMDNDELGKNIESIKFLYGWTDVGVGNASMNVTAKTGNAEQAQSLFDTVSFLQQFGKGLLGNSKKPQNAVYARLIDSAKVSNTGSDVALDLTVAQSDIDILLASLVKK